MQSGFAGWTFFLFCELQYRKTLSLQGARRLKILEYLTRQGQHNKAGQTGYKDVRDPSLAVQNIQL